MANVINPTKMRRVVGPGETITQEFFVMPVGSGSLTASISGDSIFTLKNLIGSRLGPREELPDDVIEQLPPHLREEAKKQGHRPLLEFGRVGAGIPLPVEAEDIVQGLIECSAPASHPVGTVFATLTVEGLGAPIRVPFALTVGRVRVEPLTNPVIARRGQSVQLPLRVTFPPGTPAADLVCELRGEHARIDPHTFTVPEGGSADVNLKLVSDLDAPLGTLPRQSLTVTGYDGPGLEDALVVDITIAEPAKVEAKIVRPSGDPPHARAMRGGKFRCEVEFSADPGFASDAVIFPEMPLGVRKIAPVTSHIRERAVVTLEFPVELQAAPVNGAPGKLAWRTVDGTNSGELTLNVTIDAAAVRSTLSLNIRLSELHCVDEGDGPGTAEPYLWVLFFKVDGETARLPGARLDGHVFTQRMPAGHGNLGSRDVDAGETIPIPGHLGSWNTSLVPIPITDEGTRNLVKSLKGWDDIPGVAGVLVTLLEEDSLPDDAALAGYNSLVRTFETKMNEEIANLGILQPEVSADFEENVKNAIGRAVKATILHVLDFPQKVAAWLAGPDQVLGSASWKFSHDKLAEERSITLERRWKEGVNVLPGLGDTGDIVDDLGLLLEEGPGNLITSGGEWIIKGSVNAS